MALPAFEGHPVIENPVIVRGDAAAGQVILPAAGAWDATPLEIDCSPFGAVALHFAYTRGGAAGAFDFRLEISPFGVDQAVFQDWYQGALYDAGVLAAGTDVASAIQREAITYVATGATVETFIYGPISLDGTVQRIRIPAAESGNVGAPGSLSIIGLFYE